MNSPSENLEKEIQKIIYEDLEVWKQHINDLEAKKIDKNIFKRYYVEFLQKIEENIAQFTLFFLKKESHFIANQILEDDLEKTAMLETLNEILPKLIKEKEIQKERMIYRKFQPSVSSSPVKEEKSLLYPASEIE